MVKNYWLGKHRSEETKEKISIAMRKVKALQKKTLGYINSKETREKMSKIMKEKWKNPEYAKKIISLSRKKEPNKSEFALLKVLEQIDSNWEFVGNGKFIIGNPPKNPDFINKRNKQIIEFFGKHWHRKEEELNLVNFYKSMGWNCIVLWDYEIQKILKSKYSSSLLKQLIMINCIKQLVYIT